MQIRLKTRPSVRCFVLTAICFLSLSLNLAARDAVAAQSITSSPSGEETQQEDEKKWTIEEIMKVAHKGGLLKKVATQKATAKEKEQLYEFYKTMGKLKQPAGEDKSWKALTDKLTAAAKAVVDNDKDAMVKLRAASNCSACHKIHKPKVGN